MPESTTIRFYPETEDTSMEKVETIHRESSDMASDAKIPEVREWLWATLEEPVETSELGSLFVGEFGEKNLVVLCRALDLMREQELVESFRLKEDGEWKNFWLKKNAKGGDNRD